LAADIPLAIDHFRYFASVIRAKKVPELDASTVSIALSEPLGVRIIPWNFPILMAVWKLAQRLPQEIQWC
jgi:aldehyde dehydrogenase